MNPVQETREITIEIVKHRDSDLLVAFSDDLKGLMVTGRTQQEVESRLPGSIREILEAEGYQVINVTANAPDIAGRFHARKIVASATVEAH